MTNEYYAAPDAAQPLTTIRSTQFNGNNAGLEAAFNALPNKEDMHRAQYGADVSAAAALYEVTITTLPLGYYEGLEVIFKTTFENTGAANVSVNGGTNEPIVDGNGAPLIAGSIKAGQIISLVREPGGAGTGFQLTSTVLLQADIQIAVDAATAASASASAASTSETNAGTSESNASGSASAASTSEDNAATSETNSGLDATATAADLVLTDLDTIATAADRVQTGLDATSAATSATEAAASAASIVIPQTKHKTADTARVSTATPADDDHLVGFSLDADSYYKIEGYYRGEHLGGGFRFDATVSQTPQSSQRLYSEVTVSGTRTDNSDTITAAFLTSPASSAATSIALSGVIHSHATLSSVLDIRFAQITSNVGATTLKKGSWLTLTKL